MALRSDLRATELVLGAQRMVVFSMPAEPALGLTRAEADVCLRVVNGASVATIAAARSTTERTVDKQIQSVYRKLGVSSRRELAARFHEQAEADGRGSGVVRVAPDPDPASSAMRARVR